MKSHHQNADARRIRCCLVLVMLANSVLTVGCHGSWPCGRRHIVSGDLQSRVGHGIGPGGGVQLGSIPPGVTVADGLTSDEAVALALWNNAAYQELLAQLGVSRAQLFDAGLITDPQLIIFFPIGTKQLEFTTYQAVDALWLRPIRKRAAELDLCELSEQMVQAGLNTVRDARIGHADVLLAQERVELTAENASLRGEIAALAVKRLEAGDISDLEATSSQVDELQAVATAASAVQDLRLARERLRTLIGLSLPTDQLVATAEGDLGLPLPDPQELVPMAFAMRPDLRAIEIRKAAACRRVKLAKNQFMNLDVALDANEDGSSGFEAGPGLRMSLPFWNGNKGGIAIAEALARQVDFQYTAARDRIEQEVRVASVQLEQADEQRRLVDERILPTLVEAGELARANYEGGGVPYFLVLQTTGQYVDARIRRVEAAAAVRRATAELERSVGRRLTPGA